MQIYLHPAILNRWAYIAPISPMPITPMVAFSLLRTIARPSSFESSVNASRLLCLFFLLPSPSHFRVMKKNFSRVLMCAFTAVSTALCPPYSARHSTVTCLA